MKATYRVPAENVPELTARVGRLAKRAFKLGVQSLHMEERFLETTYWWRNINTGERRETAPSGTGWIRHATDWHEVTIIGDTPKFDGWTLAGTLLVEENHVQVRSIPGEELPHRFRNIDTAYDCDHCQRSIRRRVTHVVRSEDGEYTQVGSTCIKDFLGHKDPHALARYAELLGAFAVSIQGAEDPMWASGGERHDPRWPLDDFLAWCQSSARNRGWVSKARARDDGAWATVDHVCHLMTPPYDLRSIEGWREERRKFEPTEEDREFAAAAVEWAEQEWLAKDESQMNDYEHNMAGALTSDSVGVKTLGIVGSLVAVYYRHRQQEEREERERARKTAALPVPTGRVEIEGRVLNVEERFNDFGSRVVMTVEHEDGWRVWGTVPRSIDDAKKGDVVRFTATVEPSDKDNTFGFYKRPSKAAILEEVASCN